ncbi:MAG: twin-arginine translocase subunit TatC [Bacilli bacterium]
MEKQESMTWVQHLEELRMRIIVTLCYFFITTTIAFFYVKPIYTWLVRDVPMPLTILSPTDAVWIYFMIAVVVGVVATIPMILYQFWCYIKPGLTKRESRYVRRYLPFVFLLFLAGVSFGYFVVVPMVLSFMKSLTGDMFTEMYTADRYFSFLLNMTVPLGVLFLMPVLVLVLSGIGFVTPYLLRKWRRYAYFVLMVLGVVLSPPDFMSDFIVIAPLIILYEISILLSAFSYRNRMRNFVEE